VLSPEVKRILEQAVAEARGRRQPLLTLEHVVHAMTGDPDGAALLSACGADVDKLRAKLARRLDHLPNFLPPPATDGSDLAPVVELQRALQRAALRAQSAGRATITLAGFLAAVVREKTAYAVAALKRQRVTWLSVTLHDAHGASLGAATPELPRARLLGRWRPAPRDPADRCAADRYEVVFHNDDYTTREFVIELLTTLFARSHDDAEALMLEVHERGTGSAGSYPLDEALRLVERATRAARRAEFPLRLSIVRAT
jgi:ATP-dependent Clp protease adapter protein ClpS